MIQFTKYIFEISLLLNSLEEIIEYTDFCKDCFLN